MKTTPPTPRRRSVFNFETDPELAQRFRAQCKSEGRKIGATISSLMDAWLNITEPDTWDIASDRVRKNKKLRKHHDILIAYDWDNQDEHLEWVATAPVSEILDWCKGIREQEKTQ